MRTTKLFSFLLLELWGTVILHNGRLQAQDYFHDGLSGTGHDKNSWSGSHEAMTLMVPTPAAPCLHDGDVNRDAAITAADSQIAFAIALGTWNPTSEELCSADCNGDSSVSAGDAQLIFTAVLGLTACVDSLATPIPGATATPLPPITVNPSATEAATATPLSGLTITPTSTTEPQPSATETPRLGSLGDFVWRDLNSDGWQNEEPLTSGVNGIELKLYSDLACNGFLDPEDLLVAVVETSARPRDASPGWYRFSNLESGCYLIEVVASSIPAGLTVSAESHLYATVLGPGQNRFEVDFGLRIAASISGLVLNNSTPLANTKLHLFSASWTKLQEVATDMNGFYVFNSLKEGSYFVFASGHGLGQTGYVGAYWNAEGSSHSKAHAQLIPLFSPEHQAIINFDLAPGAAVAGRVSASTGEPLAGVLVIASSINGDGCSAESLTDSNGNYRIDGLLIEQESERACPVEYVIYARPSNYGYAARYYSGATRRSEATVVSFTEPTTMSGLDIGLPITGAITGRLLTSAAEPLGGIMVAAYALHTPTPSPTTNPNLTATPTPIMTLPYSPTQTPTPVALVEVLVDSKKSNDDGEYVFENLEPGQYRIKALGDYQGWERRYLTENERPAMISVQAGEQTEGSTIYLEAAGIVSGMVVYHGSYYGSITIAFYRDSQLTQEITSVTIPGPGPFTCSGLPVGTCYAQAVVTCFAPDLQPAPIPRGIHGVNGDPAPIVVTEPPEVWLGIIRVFDPTAIPCPGNPTPTPTPIPTLDLTPPAAPILITQTAIPFRTDHSLLQLECTAEPFSIVEITVNDQPLRRVTSGTGYLCAYVGLEPDVDNHIELWSIDESGNRSIDYSAFTVAQDASPPLPVLQVSASRTSGNPPQTTVAGLVVEPCRVCVRRLGEEPSRVCVEASGFFEFQYSASEGDRLAIWAEDEFNRRSIETEISPGNLGDVETRAVYLGELCASAKAQRAASRFTEGLFFYNTTNAETTTDGCSDTFILIELTNGEWYGQCHGQTRVDSALPFCEYGVIGTPEGSVTTASYTVHNPSTPYQVIALVGKKLTPDSSELWLIPAEPEALAQDYLYDSVYSSYLQSMGYTAIDYGVHGRWHVYPYLNYGLGAFVAQAPEPWILRDNSLELSYGWSSYSSLRSDSTTKSYSGGGAMTKYVVDVATINFIPAVDRLTSDPEYQRVFDSECKVMVHGSIPGIIISSTQEPSHQTMIESLTIAACPEDYPRPLTTSYTFTIDGLSATTTGQFDGLTTGDIHLNTTSSWPIPHDVFGWGYLRFLVTITDAGTVLQRRTDQITVVKYFAKEGEDYAIGVPNWFIYWNYVVGMGVYNPYTGGMAYEGSEVYNCDGQSHEQACGLYCYDNDTIVIFDKVKNARMYYGGPGGSTASGLEIYEYTIQGIDTFRLVYQHESKHKQHRHEFWPDYPGDYNSSCDDPYGDCDHDMLPNWYEDCGNDGNPHTQDQDGSQNNGQKDEGERYDLRNSNTLNSYHNDEEMVVLQYEVDEVAHERGHYDELDWANPGKQTYPPF